MFLFSHLVYLQAATCDPDPNLMLVIWNIIMYSNLFSLICLPISLSFFMYFSNHTLSRWVVCWIYIWNLFGPYFYLWKQSLMAADYIIISVVSLFHFSIVSKIIIWSFCILRWHIYCCYVVETLTKFFCYCEIFACPFNLSKYTKHGRIIYTYRWISNTHCLFLRNWMMLVICSSCEDVLCSFISGPCKKHNICIRRSLVLRIILERSFFVFSPCSPCRSTFLYWNSVGYSFLRGTKAFELVSDPVTCNYLCSKLYNVFGSY